jgi:hypothetical protein
VIPELISEEWSGSTSANFYFDGQYVYFLDGQILTRFDEALSAHFELAVARSPTSRPRRARSGESTPA